MIRLDLNRLGKMGAFSPSYYHLSIHRSMHSSGHICLHTYACLSICLSTHTLMHAPICPFVLRRAQDKITALAKCTSSGTGLKDKTKELYD